MIMCGVKLAASFIPHLFRGYLQVERCGTFPRVRYTAVLPESGSGAGGLCGGGGL